MGNEGADGDDGAGALIGHLREGAQGLAAGIAATAKRVLRLFLPVGCCDVCFFAFDDRRMKNESVYHIILLGTLCIQNFRNEPTFFGTTYLESMLECFCSSRRDKPPLLLLLRFAQHKAQAATRLAVVCLAIVRRSSFGASGGFAAARGVLSVSHISCNSTSRLKMYQVPANYWTRPATHRCIIMCVFTPGNLFFVLARTAQQYNISSGLLHCCE